MAKPGKRHQARICALQLLYILDTRETLDLDPNQFQVEAEHYFSHLDQPVDDETRRFAEKLADGVVADCKSIDRKLNDASDRWRVDRMSRIDRNVLRIAAFELSGDDAPPAAVVINEAIELGKAYGSTESAPFINGILDKLER